MKANQNSLITVEHLEGQTKILDSTQNKIYNIILMYSKLKSGDLVYLKPNLTVPWYVPGACTSKIVIEAICRVLRDLNCRIVICEGDGGVASYSAHEAFTGNNLSDLTHKYNVRFVSLSQLPRKKSIQIVLRKEIGFELPGALVNKEYDFFINVPVLKVHMLTKLSLSLKNLWGCIPDPLRIHYHRILNEGIVAIWKAIRPDLSIIDGLIAGDGNAPINATPIPMNLLIAGCCDASIDRLGSKVLNIPFDSVKHLVIAEKEGLIKPFARIELSKNIESFCTRDFKADRRISNWGMILMSRYPTIQGFVYHSFASKIIYKILRKLRKNNIQNDLRIRHYGDPGWGEGCGYSDFFPRLSHNKTND